MKYKFNTVTLTNGKIVGNFSSYHDFDFEDGTTLPARTKEESLRLKVTIQEQTDADGDVTITGFTLTDEVMDLVEKWGALWLLGKVTHVFCPLMMIQALKHRGYNIKESPFRSVRIPDRTTRKISITKQCI